MSFRPSRRALLGACLALAAAPACAAAPHPTSSRKVVVLGDSITAGYGLPPAQAFPARLQTELARLGAPARVVPAGVVGDTTAGGLGRVGRLPVVRGDVCVVALGANDLLLGLHPGPVEANLHAIVARLQARGAVVVLAGVRIPGRLGGDYGRALDAAFAGVARRRGVRLMPDLLEGVALNPRLNQPDGIHPNAAGALVIARRLAPVVARALKAR